MGTQADREHLMERRAQVVRDLAELEEQELEAELAPEVALRLRDVYTTEMAELDASLTLLPTSDLVVEDPTVNSSGNTEAPLVTACRVVGFSTRSAVLAAAILAVVTTLILFAATGFEAPWSSAASVEVVTIPGGPIDFVAMSTADLEAYLEQFPASVDVRLDLADRHLADGDLTGATEHYAAVVDDESATSFEHSRALARIGYLAYTTGQLEASRKALTDSLALNADNTEAALYLGYVLLNGFEAPQAAIPYLEQALADKTMPPYIADDINQMLADAHQALGERP